MMSNDQLRRTSVIAGSGGFVLALLGCLIVVEPGTALLIALGAGVALGTGLFAAGTVVTLSRPPALPAPRPVTRAAQAPAEAPVGPTAGPPNDDTARLSPDDVVRAADLHQTIRLDQEHLDYVL